MRAKSAQTPEYRRVARDSGFGASHRPGMTTLSSLLLPILAVKQLLRVLGDVVVDMREADDAINGPADPAGTGVANEDGTGGRPQAVRFGFQPVVVFDYRFDPPIRRNFDTHAGQRL